jgi:glucosyl-3-phosphoglycerate phosphatase
MTRLIVWRHGSTDWNAGQRVQGQSDAPLNDVGREQSAVAAAHLVRLRPDVIVSSDLSRATDTAAALAALTGLAVRTDARLRERYYGLWQGLTLTEVAERFPAEHARWRAGDQSPGAEIESLDDLGKRAGEAFHNAAEALPGATVVVVTHGGAARQAIGYLLGWPAPVLRALGPLHNCHWSELRHGALDRAGRAAAGDHHLDGWQLRSHNVGVMAESTPSPPV